MKIKCKIEKMKRKIRNNKKAYKIEWRKNELNITKEIQNVNK